MLPRRPAQGSNEPNRFSWVERHYRDRLAPADLADPQLATESLAALNELSRLLELGAVYPFQLE